MQIPSAPLSHPPPVSWVLLTYTERGFPKSDDDDGDGDDLDLSLFFDLLKFIVCLI